MSLAAGRPDVVLIRQVVDTVEEAERVGFHGSPSMLINGADPFEAGGASVGLACRRYLTPHGPAGVPTTEQLRAAMDVRADPTEGLH